MSVSSDPKLVRRLVEFELSLTRDSSESVEEFGWGLLIHNPKVDALWSGNYLDVRTTDLDADALAELAEQLLAPRKLRASLHRAGRSRLRGPARSGVPRTRPLDGAAERLHGSRSGGQSRDRPGERGPPRRDRRGAPRDGTPGAPCVLYERDGIGQVESVTTMPERREEGLASAVVMAAARASRERGDELTFIVADGDDWPWRLYERLGFDRVGEVCDFLIKPPQLRGDSSP